MVVMGRIVAPYGIQGWLKVQPETETLDSLLDYPDWWLGRDDDLNKSPWQKYEVESAKVHVNILLVKLRGINDRDAAMAVKSRRVAVPREQLPEAGEDEYYWSDLVGVKVINQQQIDFGVITEVLETGANDVIVMRQDGPGGQERLLPFIDHVVMEVDLETRTMLVDWPVEWDSES
jgi:16S rRNA processing protein RimM